MNDEIKRKIDFIKQILERNELIKCNRYFNDLLDYITNLEKRNKEIYDGFMATQEELTEYAEENERLKEIWKDTNVIVKDNKTLVMNTNAYDILEDYKSRCEKALSIIEKQKTKMYKSRNKIAMFILMKLENILQNGSDKE